MYLLTWLLTTILLWKLVEGIYMNSVTNSSTCTAKSTYGPVKQCDHCFYFAEQSRCVGGCEFDVEFDPVTFLQKNGSSTCCAPTVRALRTTTLWCHCGKNCGGRLTDERFPGWSYEVDFKYYQAVACDCVVGDWQDSLITMIERSSTYKPDEDHLRCAMYELVIVPGLFAQFQFIPDTQIIGAATQPAAINGAESCLIACLTFNNCAGFDVDAAGSCFLALAGTIAVGKFPAVGIQHYTRISSLDAIEYFGQGSG